MKQQKIEFHGTEIIYELSNARRKTVGIKIQPDGTVIVKAPRQLSDQAVKEIVYKKGQWILKKLGELAAASVRPIPVYTPEEKQKYLQVAKERFGDRVWHYAQLMGEENLGTVRLKELKSRWGSCSIRRNLNFNWKLVLAPPEVLDYVVVHELCHLKEMNHSSRFWDLVEAYCPDYRECRAWLKDHGPWL